MLRPKLIEKHLSHISNLMIYYYVYTYCRFLNYLYELLFQREETK